MKLTDFMNLQRNSRKCRLCKGSLVGENATPSSCGHAFHIECLKRYTEENKSDSECKCPIEGCGRLYTAIAVRKSIGGPVEEYKTLAADNQCPICCEEVQPPVAHPDSCNHYFCLSCLSQWAKYRHQCPLDRGQFEIMLLSDYIGGPIIERRPTPPIKSDLLEEFFEDNTECEICHSPDDEEHLLLCDGCDKGFHTYCLPTPLSEIPEGDWFCPTCETVRRLEMEDEVVNGSASIEAESDFDPFDGLADPEAEEAGGDYEDSGDEEPENLRSYIHILSNRSQERLQQEAESRYRGAGLLRDIIENLTVRAEREQRERRRNRRNNQRRRVRLEDSVNESVSGDLAVTDENATSSAHSGATASTNTGVTTTTEGSSSRKRRRVVGFSSSESEDERGAREGPSSRRRSSPSPPPPSTRSKRRRLQLDEDEEELQASNHVEENEDSFQSPIETRIRRGATHPVISTPQNTSSEEEEEEEGEEDEEESVSTVAESSDDATTEEEGEQLNNSARDIFESFNTDPELGGLVDEIHQIASHKRPKKASSSTSAKDRREAATAKSGGKSNPKRKRRRRTKRRRKTTSMKMRKRKTALRRVRLCDSQLEASTASTSSGAKGAALPTSKLSVFGSGMGVESLLEPDEEPTTSKNSTSSTSTARINRNASSPPSNLLSSIMAGQEALFRFGSGNMRVNPDNSISPPQVAGLVSSSSHKRSQDAPLSQQPGPSMSCLTKRSPPSVAKLPSSSTTASVTSLHGASSKPDSPSSVQPSSSKASAEVTSASSTSLSTTWSSAEAARAREVVVTHLAQAHPSLKDNEIKLQLIKRALSKILSKAPYQVKEAKMRKLVDDYVSFFQRNPPTRH